MHSVGRLRWGVIGLGVGNQHALALLGDDNAELAAVCDANPATLERVAAEYGNVRKFESEEEMFAEVELDAVCVASYDWDHARTIVTCLERGLHVFAEKPIGVNFDEYGALIQCLRGNRGVRLTTNTLLRRSPRFVWLKSEIADGRMGKLMHVQADYLYGRLPKLTRGWRGSNNDYSVTLGGAIHMVDLLLWLVGERPVSVSGIGSRAGLEMELADGASAGFQGDSFRVGLLTFSSGLTASVSANYASVGPHFHRVDVFGTSGTFMNLPNVDGFGPSAPGSVGLIMHGLDPGIAQTVDEPYPAVPKSTLLVDFNRAILQGIPTAVSEQQAMDALVVCLALDEAVRTKHPVPITYDQVPTRHYSVGRRGTES